MCISFLFVHHNIKGIEKKNLHCALKEFVCAHRNSLGKLHYMCSLFYDYKNMISLSLLAKIFMVKLNGKNIYYISAF